MKEGENETWGKKKLLGIIEKEREVKAVKTLCSNGIWWKYLCMLSYPQENLTVFLMLTIFSNITIESVSKSFSQKNAKYHERICMPSRGIKSTTCGSKKAHFSSLLKTIQVFVIDPLSIVEQLKEQKSLSVFFIINLYARHVKET